VNQKVLETYSTLQSSMLAYVQNPSQDGEAALFHLGLLFIAALRKSLKPATLLPFKLGIYDPVNPVSNQENIVTIEELLRLAILAEELVGESKLGHVIVSNN